MVTSRPVEPWAQDFGRQIAKLLELVADGQRAALAELYKCLGPAVHGSIRRHLADPVEAGHALRAVFVGVWLMARYRPPPPEQRDWVTRMTERRTVELLPPETGADDGATTRSTLPEQITNEFHFLMGTLDHLPTLSRPTVGGRPLLATSFDRIRIRDVRRQVTTLIQQTDLEEPQAREFVLAINEIAVNAIRHGGGAGELYLWQDGALVCEVRDHGTGFDPSGFVNRTDAPEPSPSGGMGLWIARCVCATVSISSTAGGTTSRIRAGVSPFATARQVSEPG